MLDATLQFVGRLHPAVLHVPIGAFIALLAVEAWWLARRTPAERSVRMVLVTLTAISGVAAAGAGWMLAEEPGYSGDTLTLHRWFGVGFAGLAAAAWLASVLRLRRAYAACLIGAGLSVGPAGHLGGEITHGPGFLTAPFRSAPPRAAAALTTTDEPALPAEIARFFENHCVSCHGTNRQKGGLALHTPQALFAGGDYGPVVTPGQPDQSELAIRLLLPVDDEFRMPPENRPQPGEDEIDAVLRWIEEGARLQPPPEEE
jgi:mono/diheme cytochrome c family protein/uncharacterized membrane protein